MVAIAALSLGDDGDDLGLLIRGREHSVAIVLDAEQERELYAQVFGEHSARTTRRSLCPVAGE